MSEFEQFLHESLEGHRERELRLSEPEAAFVRQRFPQAVLTRLTETGHQNKSWYHIRVVKGCAKA